MVEKYLVRVIAIKSSIEIGPRPVEADGQAGRQRGRRRGRGVGRQAVEGTDNAANAFAIGASETKPKRVNAECSTEREREREGGRGYRVERIVNGCHRSRRRAWPAAGPSKVGQRPAQMQHQLSPVESSPGIVYQLL